MAECGCESECQHGSLGGDPRLPFPFGSRHRKRAGLQKRDPPEDDHPGWVRRHNPWATDMDTTSGSPSPVSRPWPIRLPRSEFKPEGTSPNATGHPQRARVAAEDDPSRGATRGVLREPDRATDQRTSVSVWTPNLTIRIVYRQRQDEHFVADCRLRSRRPRAPG